MTGHASGNISLAMDKMKDLELIKEEKRQRGMRRGREEIFYQLTDKGYMAYIATECHEPEEFWKTMINYSKSTRATVNLIQTLLQFYEVFARVHLHRLQGYSIISKLNAFDQLFLHCQEEYLLRVSEVTVEQKVLEILAVQPGRGLRELSLEAGEPEGAVLSTLQRMSTVSDNLEDQQDAKKRLTSTRRELETDHYKRLLRMAIISDGRDERFRSYSLSLIGVLLMVFLLRRQSSFVQPAQPLGNRFKLFYDSVTSDGMLISSTSSFSKKVSIASNSERLLLDRYFDIIAVNYGRKLPLILGKWSLLKDTIGSHSIYNFDILIDHSLREKATNQSILNDGIGEYLDAAMKQAEISERKFEETFFKGFSAILAEHFAAKYVTSGELSGRENPFPSKGRELISLTRLLGNLSLLLDFPHFSKEYRDQFFKTTLAGERNFLPLFGDGHGIELLEKEMADAISFIYYLNLVREKRFMTFQWLSDYMEANSDRKDKKILSPVKALEHILKQDDVIFDFFFQWMQQIHAHFTQTRKHEEGLYSVFHV